MVPASNEFWAVAFSAAIGVIVSLGLAYATVGTGIDLTIGAVPIDTAIPAVQAASSGH